MLKIEMNEKMRMNIYTGVLCLTYGYAQLCAKSTGDLAMTTIERSDPMHVDGTDFSGFIDIFRVIGTEIGNTLAIGIYSISVIIVAIVVGILLRLLVAPKKMSGAVVASSEIQRCNKYSTIGFALGCLMSLSLVYPGSLWLVLIYNAPIRLIMNTMYVSVLRHFVEQDESEESDDGKERS